MRLFAVSTVSIVFSVLVALGTVSFTSSATQPTALEETLDAAEKLGVRTAGSCDTLGDVDYLKALETSEGTVQFAGCGGLL